jgi:hypothetical protein
LEVRKTADGIEFVPIGQGGSSRHHGMTAKRHPEAAAARRALGRQVRLLRFSCRASDMIGASRCDPGCVKTPTLFYKVEFSSQFRGYENQQCSQRPS